MNFSFFLQSNCALVLSIFKLKSVSIINLNHNPILNKIHYIKSLWSLKNETFSWIQEILLFFKVYTLKYKKSIQHQFKGFLYD